jgi:hypothetical protein
MKLLYFFTDLINEYLYSYQVSRDAIALKHDHLGLIDVVLK